MKPSKAAKAARDRTVKGLLEEVNLEVAALPDASLRALIPHLVHVQRELSADLAEVLAGYEGPESWTAQMMRRALYQVQGAINQVERVRPAMVQELRRAGKVAGQLANKHLGKELSTFSKHFDQTLTPIPIIPASKLAERILVERYVKSAQKWGVRGIQEIKSAVVVGHLRGETVGQMTDRLLGAGRSPFKGMAPADKVTAISQKMYNRIRYDAYRVVRTEVISAYNAHAYDQLAQVADLDPRIMQRWDAEIDGRSCAQCKMMDGMVVPVGEVFPGARRGDPPVHPMCRCAVVAWRSDWKEGAGARMASPRAVEMGGEPVTALRDPVEP